MASSSVWRVAVTPKGSASQIITCRKRDLPDATMVAVHFRHLSSHSVCAHLLDLHQIISISGALLIQEHASKLSSGQIVRLTWIGACCDAVLCMQAASIQHGADVYVSWGNALVAAAELEADMHAAVQHLQTGIELYRGALQLEEDAAVSLDQ